jgi:hypothetical protein
MFPLTRENVGQYLAAFGERDWDRIDFRAFSKACTPGLRRYRFSFEEVLRQQQQQQRPPTTAPATAAGP